jgi:putative hydrolase of HD superfamily
MIVNFSLVNELFKGFYIQRWNDRIRPLELIEMDKHAHKMMIAYCIGKYEEEDGKEVNWDKIIKSGIYELLRRIVISDIKSPIYNEIKKNKSVFEKLNKYVYEQLEPKINSDEIRDELYEFLVNSSGLEDINDRIINASHNYASLWEFQIIRNSNPFHYQNSRIGPNLLNRVDEYQDLIGMKKIMMQQPVATFIDMCGQLRFQYRWAQLPRVPKTSVLGHVMLVAIISYFFARDNGAEGKRLFNDFFCGLFHDLPEIVTRDIISPVKMSSPEFDELIKKLEKDLTEQEIYPFIDERWHNEMKYYTVDEFSNKIVIENQIQRCSSVNEINEKYNSDEFNPLDGELIRAADRLSAFLEAWNSCSAGIKTEELSLAAQKIKDDYKNRKIGKLNLGSLYTNFKQVC